MQYRRVDRYLTPLNVPMKQHRLDELTTYVSGDNRAEQRAHDEIPLFLAIRARLAPA